MQDCCSNLMMDMHKHGVCNSKRMSHLERWIRKLIDSHMYP